jgi:tetratricopeptide (TPR) repeat protein
MFHFVRKTNPVSTGSLILVGLAALLPLLVVPFTEQFMIDSKLFLLFAATIALGALFIISHFQQKLITISITPLSIPVLALGVVALAGSFFTGNYPVENLLGFGGAYVSIALLVFFGSRLLQKETTFSALLSALSVSGILLTVSTILQFVGFGPSRILNILLPIPLPNTAAFNLSGSSLIATQFLAVILVGLVVTALQKKFMVPMIQKLAMAVVAVGLVVHVVTLLPGQVAQPTILPMSASWTIAVDGLKSPRIALLGFGPQSFSNAYNQLKPQWLNNEAYWTVQFTQAANTPFTLMVTMGLLGLITWLLLVWTVFNQTKQVSEETKPLHYMILALLLLQFMLPPTIVMVSLLGVLLTLWANMEADRFSELEIYGLTLRVVKKRNFAHPLSNNAKLVLYVFNVLVGLLLIGAAYGATRAYAAQVQLFRSTRAAQNNDAVSVYNLQQSAVQLNPFLDTIRRSYGLTNLTIAAALAQKAERTPEETQQFSQLVQQAIREGKAATILDPSDANNWSVLSQIYRSLIGVADGSEQWAVTSYVTAIETAPTNAQLRVELGGVLYAQQQYEEAVRFFQQAINLKPDYANAYYNLANAYRQLGELEQAKVAYQQTLVLVPAESEDYRRASDELASLANLKPNDAAGSTNQQPPANGQPVPSPTPLPEVPTQPSVTEQNTLETPGDTVSQPSDQPLTVNPAAASPTPSASASPAPSASPSL